MTISSTFMDSANTSGITSYTIPLGVEVLLYNGLVAGGAQAPFGLPPQGSNYRGRVVFYALGIGGAATAVIGQVETDVGSGTFGIFNQWSGTALQPFSAINFGLPVSLDLSGLGGAGKIRLNLTAFTLGSATTVNVYARIG